jgi:hypothetical protein
MLSQPVKNLALILNINTRATKKNVAQFVAYRPAHRTMPIMSALPLWRVKKMSKCTEFCISEDEEEYEKYEGWLPPCPICGSDLADFEPEWLEAPLTCNKCGTELIILPSTETDPNMAFGGKICPISKPKVTP